MQTVEPGATLVGRESELREAAAAIEVALAGDVSICLFVGAAGAGKTTLLHTAVELARGAGFRILSCAPVSREATLAYASLADLLRPIERDRLDRLPPPQRHALLAGLQEEEAGSAASDHAAGAGLRTLVAALADDGPLCIAADDLQWMDRSSLRALGFALRRVEGAPLLVLGTRRQNATTGHLERDASPGHLVRVVHPSALRVAAMHHVLRQALGTTFPRPTLVRITTLSNGNPLLAIELGRSVLERGGVLGAGQRPSLAGPNVRRLLGRRIADLAHDQRRTLLVAALVEGGSLTQARAVHASLGWPFDPPGPDNGLVAIERDEIRFGHPLYLEASLDAATPDDTAAVHRAIADQAIRPDVRARHLAEASSGPDEDVADAIDIAAEQAIASGAIDEALELTSLALERSLPDSPRRADRLLRHADVLIQSGDTKTGDALLVDALTVTLEPSERVVLLLRLAAVRSPTRPAVEVRPLCDEAIRLAGSANLAVAEAELVLADIAGTPRDGLRHVRRALRIMGPTPPPELQARALTIGAVLRAQTGRPVSMAPIDRAVALEDLQQRERLMDSARFARGWLRLVADDLDRSRDDFATVLQLARDRGDEATLPGVLAQLGHLELRAGNWSDAREILTEMIQVADRSDQRFWLGLAYLQFGQIEGLTGNRPRAVEDLDAATAIADELDDAFIRSMALLARSLLAIGDERYAEAADLAAASRSVLEGRTEDPGMYPWLGLEIEAAARSGRLDEARVLVDDFERRARTARRRRAIAVATECRALIAAADGDIDAAVALASDAARRLGRLPVPFDHARSLLILGSLRRRRREKRAADETLARAQATFERLGAVAWVRQAQAERARIGLRPRAPSQLTETELRIARLAAAGRSNREIAAEAFASPKTVEANLARVYQKLGIRRRAELGSRLADLHRPD